MILFILWAIRREMWICFQGVNEEFLNVLISQGEMKCKTHCSVGNWRCCEVRKMYSIVPRAQVEGRKAVPFSTNDGEVFISGEANSCDRGLKCT